MKRNHHFCTITLLVLTAFLLVMNGSRRRDEALASRIAPEILRFHVLANSNKAEDQTLKLAVKDFLLETIQEDLASSCAETSPSISKHMLEQYILDNRSNLEIMTEQYMKEQGADYSAEITLESCAFPQKTYGDMCFPAGTYDAVRVKIGEAKGENFWCVLYPSLCYLNSTHAVVPDSSKEQLQMLLPEDDFYALFTAKRGAPDKNTEQESLLPRIQIRFRLSELFFGH